MTDMEDYGLLSTHWALGSLVLIGLASSEFAGAATIVALPITALTIMLGNLCKPKPQHTLLKRRKMCDVVEFLEIWTNTLELLAAAATCARIASATMDYMSRGRLRDWLFGLESHSLGEPWPDVLGVTIVVVTTALFMLGLDKSTSLSILLYIGLGTSFIFFIVVGSFHTDIIFWNWAEDFNMNNWKCILTTAAMCSYAFPNNIQSVQHNSRKVCLKYGCFLLVPLLCYLLIVVVFTLMSHFRELSGTAIPLVRVFEVRDVDWARPVMATCTIFVGCIALTEIIPSICHGIMRLASKEWRMLISSLMYQNPVTGAPVLAIFIVGSLTSILAFACPLSYLVHLLNVSPLIKCALRSSRALYSRYKYEFIHEDLSGSNNQNLKPPVVKQPFSVQHTNIQYSRLQKGPSKKPSKPSPARRIKTAFDIMPRFLRNTSCTTSGINGGKGFSVASSEDKECLLMDDYSVGPTLEPDSDSEYDGNNASQECSDIEADSSSSSTDIDAIVQEYKEKIRVTTVNPFSDSKAPTRSSSRTVLVAIFLINASSAFMVLDLFYNVSYLSYVSLLVIFISAITIFFMPQSKLFIPQDFAVPKTIFSISSVLSIVLSVVLAMMILAEVWLGVVVWTCGGLLLFCRCDCCNCEGLCPTSNERMRLQGPRKEFASTFANQHPDHIDTVLIAR